MKLIDDKEKLALLGFADSRHSLSWYRKEYENLPMILERFIVDTLGSYGVFPKEATGSEQKMLYHKYYLMIERTLDGYIVKVNDTDRMMVFEEHVFNCAEEAARFLITRSYTSGGSINQYWK